MSDCNNCAHIKNLEDKIITLREQNEEIKKELHDKNKSVWYQIEESKKERKEFLNRISELERKSDVTEEKIDRIFSALDAIEKNVEKIANSLDCIQKKPAKTYENLQYEAIKYIVVAVIAFIAAKFIK